MAACTYYYIRKKHPAITLVLRWPIHPKIKQVLQLMTNLFLRSLTLNLTLLFAVKEAAKYGTISLSAHTIGINLWLFAAFFIDGYGDSANALSGKLLGAKDAKGLLHLNRLILKYAFSLGVILTLIGFIAAPYIGYVFTEEVEVLTQFDKVFPVVLITFPISAIAFVYDGFYKGLGEAAFLRNTLLTASLIGFLPSFYLFDSFGFNLMAVWYAIGVWMIIRALFPYFYFKLYIRRI
jgi:Na+-driven multidrug efflux pump